MKLYAIVYQSYTNVQNYTNNSHIWQNYTKLFFMWNQNSSARSLTFRDMNTNYVKLCLVFGRWKLILESHCLTCSKQEEYDTWNHAQSLKIELDNDDVKWVLLGDKLLIQSDYLE